jgi:DNA-binding XRE family transcriptional regulator
MAKRPSMQTIITPNGETLVILPLAEYEKLVDQADIARADKIVDAIAAGDDELVPADVVKRILDGDSKVRVWRTHRGMSARDVATATGLSAPYISEIESGKKEGSISAMKKIAEALKVDLDDLV